MNYREFADEVSRRVRDRLGENASVTLRQVVKNNGVAKDSLMICSKGDHISPLIYLDEYYEIYRKGTPLEEIVTRLTETFQEKRGAASFNVQEFLDREKVREHVVCRLVNREKNAGILDDIPHRGFLNLEIIYYYQNTDGNKKMPGYDCGSVLIRKEHLRLWELDEDTLDRCAGRNMPVLVPSRFCSMQEIMEELLGTQMPPQEDQLPLYVLTSSSKNFGAYWISDTEVMSHISDTLEGDFYVLPSSVHECMIVPASEGIDVDQLLKMVREINADQVPPEEILADSVYRFDREARELCIAAG